MIAACTNDDVLSGPEYTRQEPVEFRQLRHQTKNTLQRIIIQVLAAPFLAASREGRRAADDLVRRIELSAAISDALFGLTKAPEILPDRLKSLAQCLIDFYTDGAQTILLDVAIPGGIKMSRQREDRIAHIVHELAINALKHGMHLRLVGKLSITLGRQEDGGLVLSVVNDGWEMGRMISQIGGIGIVWDLVQAEGGDMRIITQPETCFLISFPPESKRVPDAWPCRMIPPL